MFVDFSRGFGEIQQGRAMALVECRRDGTHQYPSHLRSCPYCAMPATAPPSVGAPVKPQVPASVGLGGRPAISRPPAISQPNPQVPTPRKSSGSLKWLVGLSSVLLVAAFAFTRTSGGDRSVNSTAAAEPVAVLACDLSKGAVSASQTPPDGVDSAGRSVRYSASNLVDGDEATAWRAPGAAVGDTISFKFSAPCKVSAIEILNGYHKVDQADGTDRWEQNRRVKNIELYLDTVPVAATLDTSSRNWQRIDAAGAAVTSITIKILSSSPSKPERDFTALSEVRAKG